MYAYERTKTPNGPVNPRTRPIDFGRSSSSTKLSPYADDLRRGQERLEDVAYRDRPTAGPAAAVWLGERLVQVDVDDVEAHVAGPHDPADRVQVGAVVVHERARAVEDALDLLDPLVEESERRRVREHQRRRLAVHLAA